MHSDKTGLSPDENLFRSGAPELDLLANGSESKDKVSSPLRIHLIYGIQILADAFRDRFALRSELDLHGISTYDEFLADEIDTAAIDALLIDGSADPEAAIDVVIYASQRLSGIEIVLLGVETPGQIVQFLEAGATGCVPRAANFQKLLDTIQALLRDEAVCCPTLAASVIQRLAELSREVDRRPREPVLEQVQLTSRESEVLQLVAGGYQNKEIARQLGISLPTVKNHVHKIIGKLDASDRREAIRSAYQNGLLEDPFPWLERRLHA